MRVALIQLELGATDMERNCAKASSFMAQAAAAGAGAVCFPEVQLSGFFPQYPGQDASRYAIPIDHPLVKRLASACRELRLVGFPNVYLREGGRCFDASPVIDADGTILGVSKMVHIAQLPCFYEQDYYAPSDTGFPVYDTAIGKVGVVICFDRHLPESIRTCALRGARLIVIPTANTTAEPLDLFEWEMRVAAMQNGVFIAMCNRVGLEGQMHFAGESLVVDPDGNVVAKAAGDEQILYADIDLALVDQARARRPYLRLRRPEMYEK